MEASHNMYSVQRTVYKPVVRRRSHPAGAFQPVKRPAKGSISYTTNAATYYYYCTTAARDDRAGLNSSTVVASGVQSEAFTASPSLNDWRV